MAGKEAVFINVSCFRFDLSRMSWTDIPFYSMKADDLWAYV